MKTQQSLEATAFDVSKLDDGQLLNLRAVIDTEARRRGLSFNVGEIGEKLVIQLFNSRPDLPVLLAAQPGTKSIDALSRAGDRYSIKTLQRAKKTGTIYPDPKDPDKQLFEFLLIVLVNENLELEQVIELDWLQFCAVRKWDITMRAWYVARSKSALELGRQIYPKT